ncbi:hypothetical protein TSAR_011634, partial [Trichomalopsis sarcophagae]
FSYNDDRGGTVYVVAWCLYALDHPRLRINICYFQFFFVNDDRGDVVYVVAWYFYALGVESESQQIFFSTC